MKVARLFLLLIIASLLLAVYYFGFSEHLALSQLRQNYRDLKQLAEAHPAGAAALYILLYTLVVTLSIPGAIYVTLLGGFMFPQPFSTIYAIVGATIGAVIIYSIVRFLFGTSPWKGVNRYVDQMEANFKEDAVSYLLFLRLVPLFPFWLVNIAPACVGVSIFTFTWTTIIGIAPATFVYTQVGSGLGFILESGETFSARDIMSVNVIITLVGLGILAILPVIFKKFKKHPKEPDD